MNKTVPRQTILSKPVLEADGTMFHSMINTDKVIIQFLPLQLKGKSSFNSPLQKSRTYSDLSKKKKKEV